MSENYLNLEQLTYYDRKMKDWVGGRCPANTQEQLNALDVRLDSAESDIGTLEGQMSTANSNIASNSNDITEIRNQISAMSSGTVLRGKFASLEDVSNPVHGDIAIVDQKEYIYLVDAGGGSTWVELGDTTSEGNRISTLEDEMDAVQAAAGSAVQNGSGVTGNNSTTTVTKTGTTLKVKVDVNTTTTINSTTSTAIPTAGAVQTKFNALDHSVSDPVTVTSIVTNVTQENGPIKVFKTEFKAITTEQIESLFS